jgi:heat-inducible transcriptional repressor
VVVSFGGEVGLPELRDCAVVTAPCAAGAESLGLVGVLGPSRMDYPRVVPLVELLSELVAEKMVA